MFENQICCFSPNLLVKWCKTISRTTPSQHYCHDVASPGATGSIPSQPVPACSGASGVNPWITGWALARPGSRWCVGIGLNIMEIWKLSAASREAHGGENVKSKAKGFEKNKTVKHLKNISLNKITWDFGGFRKWDPCLCAERMDCLYILFESNGLSLFTAALRIEQRLEGIKTEMGLDWSR